MPKKAATAEPSKELEVEFEKASKEVQDLSSRPKDSDLLKLYALFKQATVGNLEGDRPGLFDFKGRAKYDAWAKLKGIKKPKAMQSYIDFVAELKEDYG